MELDPLMLEATAGAVDRLGRVWHRHRVIGADHVPRDRPCVITIRRRAAVWVAAALHRHFGLRLHLTWHRVADLPPGHLAWAPTEQAVDLAVAARVPILATATTNAGWMPLPVRVRTAIGPPRLASAGLGGAPLRRVLEADRHNLEEAWLVEDR